MRISEDWMAVIMGFILIAVVFSGAVQKIPW